MGEAERLGVPPLDLRQRVSNARSELRALDAQLADDVARYVDARLDALVHDETHFRFTPTLLHADLSPDHLLIDERDHRLTGVIDFGDTCIGDPDYEYLYLSADMGLAFACRVMHARGLVASPERLIKLSLLQTLDHVQYIVCGLRYGRRELIDEGIADLTREARSASELG